MSGFSLHPLETEALLDQRVGNPENRDVAPSPGFFDNAAGATGTGLLAGITGVRKVADDLTRWIPDSFFEDDNTPSHRNAAGGLEADVHRETSAEYGKTLNELRPDPQTTGMLGSALHNLTSIAPPLVMGTAVGGPVGGAAAVGAVTGDVDYQNNITDGLDPNTAAGKAAITGVTNALGVLMPGGIGANLLDRMAVGAGSQVGFGMASRGVTGEYLHAHGYDDMANQYRAFDGTSILMDAVAGTAFGAVAAHSGMEGGSAPEFPDSYNPVPDSPVPSPRQIDGPTPMGETGPEPQQTPTQPAPEPVAPQVLPSDIDTALTANGMNQFEIDAAPGVPTTPSARNAHVAAMDTAYRQMMNDEPVDVTEQLHAAEMLPKQDNNPLHVALNEALEQGGYGDILREAEDMRNEAIARNIPLGEDLVAPDTELDTGDLYTRATDLAAMSTEARPHYAEAARIHDIVTEGRSAVRNFKLFNRDSSVAVQKATAWPTRPLPLMEFIQEAGGIKSGLSVDEVNDMRVRGVALTDYYNGELRDLFDGKKGSMNRYVKHDGLSMEDELPQLAAEQGYLGPALADYDYRSAHPEEAQQRLVEAIKKGINGKAVYDYHVEDALVNVLSDNQATKALKANDAAEGLLNDLSKHGLDTTNPTVPDIAEALARRQTTIDSQAVEPAARTAAEAEAEEYADIGFMRAPEVREQFPKPVDAEDINPLGFYSQLSRVANQKLPGKGTGADMAKALDAYAKSGDFKPEELEYSGVKEWLSTQDKVSKTDVLDFLKEGGVTLQEVSLERKVDMVPDTTSYTVRRNYGEYNIVDESRGVAIESFDNEADAFAALPEYLNGLEKKVTDDTKYSKYTLPGGENYREVLLTLPTGSGRAAERRQELTGIDRERELTQAEQNEYESLRDIAYGKNDYTSGHWDQKNVLAHFRLADHIDADGNKVMLIEEIQSDWHQAGRKKGYQKDGQQVDQSFAKNFFGISDEDWSLMPEEQRQGYVTEIAEGDTHVRQGMRDMVPDAPFKKTWAELSFKRILRMAAEKGYQKVAWTTGEMQADRFDLSKQISKVEWRGDPNSTHGQLKAYDNDGRVVMNSVMKDSEVEDHIGKDIAKKLLESPDGELAESGQSSKVLEGVDLKVGGEGMKGFYDDILPKTVGKVIGKLDKAAKVGEVVINKAPSDPLEQVPMHQTDEGTKVHGFDLTDELRDRVMMGLPQFYRDAPKQTEKPEFKAWFGDSKVVDTNGQPMVVYHGTSQNFDAFSPEMVGSEFGQDSRGYFFTDSKPMAEVYARNTSYGLNREKEGPTLATYLSLKNPLVVNIDYDPVDTWDNNHQSLQNQAADGGYDGIIIKSETGPSMFVAFEPTQIKSAIGNNGNFDPKDPRIAFNRNEQGIPAEATPYGRGMARMKAEGMSADDALVAQEVNNAVARMLPGAEVRMAAKLFATEETGAAGEVFGAYRRPLNVRESRGVVDWSLAAPDAVGVARHEVVHGLKATGLFKPEEWDALTEAAQKEDWIGQAKLGDGYKPEQLLEEAIAERFRQWRRETPENQVRGVSGLIYKVFARLHELLQKVAAMARRYMGLKPTADDVFARMESGEVGKRESAADDNAKAGKEKAPQYPVSTAEQILADTPDIRIPDMEGGLMDGKLAMMDADADGIRAEQFAPTYEVAVNCFARDL